jgi:predicted O-methyltransferase YrrM
MSSPHRDVLVGLVQKYGWTRGAELGVDKGILFERLLRECPGLSLVGVDVFPVPHRQARCASVAETYGARAMLVTSTTRDASELFEDGFFDFVFIDADHSEAAVTDDIVHWTGKVRAGGLLCGHDYNKKFPGVVKAVDKAFPGKVRPLPGSIWGVWR